MGERDLNLRVTDTNSCNGFTRFSPVSACMKTDSLFKPLFRNTCKIITSVVLVIFNVRIF